MPQQLHERTGASPPLDDASARRAHIRAIASGLVDGPRMGHRFHVPEGVPLAGSARLRSHSRRRLPAADGPRPRPGRRRIVAAGLLVVQLAALVALLNAPAFKVHSVDVRGDVLLGRDTVLAAARVPQGSLFTVDGDAIRARVSRLPWVRSAVVTTQLPSTVHIALTEWQPDLLVHSGSRNDFVAGNGATLAFTAATASARKGIAVLLDERVGSQSLMSGLADLLANAAARWRSTFGCGLDAFVISATNQLSAWCSTGWQVVFGTLDSSAALAAVPGQLAVLAALKTKLDYTKPTFGYVRLDNPSEPAIGGTAGEPAALTAEIAATATPEAPTAASAAPNAPDPTGAAAPGASASAAPATPTPRPSPTPLVFTVAPPSPTPRH